MPPDTNRGPTVAGGWVRLGGRRSANGSCRDEVLGALIALRDRTGRHVFTVREVYAEMVATGTQYAESTVFKTMQRMRSPAERPPFTCLERVGQEGFRLLTEDRSAAVGPAGSVGGAANAVAGNG